MSSRVDINNAKETNEVRVTASGVSVVKYNMNLVKKCLQDIAKKGKIVKTSQTKQMVLNEDLNRHGSLFGGKMMAWMDLAAAIHAAETMQMNCVTVKVNEIVFKAPAHLGDIITFECWEESRGNTSLTIGIKATKSNLKEKNIEIATSSFKFVAIGDDGKPSNAWNK
jgi:acyl-CoA hydrolase